MESYIDELKQQRFTSKPWAGEEELTLDGKKIYTSLSLKENVKKVSKKFLPKIYNVISSMIDSNKLIPVFLNKNLRSYLSSKNKLKTHSLATTRGDTIYVFLDRFYSLLKMSSINEKKLSIILVHELIHVSGSKQPRKFLQINYNVFLSFYKEFFSSLLAVELKNISNDIINGLIKRIIKSKQKGAINFRNVYFPTFKLLESHSAYSEKEYQDIYDKFIDYLDSQIRTFSINVPHEIWEAGRSAYIKIAEGKNETLAQEFWNPEEIICILSEINPNHQNVVKSINLLK